MNRSPFTEFDRMAARFPDPDFAPPDEPICQGGNLRPITLLCAYSKGIFPWYSEGMPILWWSPDPRCALIPQDFHLPRSSRRKIRDFRITLDNAFEKVIGECAVVKRKGQNGTWITHGIEEAYIRLHKMGYAHSVETWSGSHLVGGLYGIALGKAFFGESMFHRESEASRAALRGLTLLLCQKEFQIIDCQQETPHMLRMGAKMLDRHDFLRKLSRALEHKTGSAKQGELCPWAGWHEKWQFDGDIWHLPQ